MTYDFANAIKARPAQSELMRVLGDPRGPREVRGDRRGAFIADPAWARSHLVRVSTDQLPGWPRYGGRPVSAVTLHRIAADHLVATWAEVCRRGLHTRLRSYDGAFVPRHMLWNPANALSVHAWGLALDLDAAWNAYGIPHDRMQIDRDVVRVFEECGWTWGGRWSESDGMHFQFTDPLPGTDVPTWQDAVAQVAPSPPTPSAPVAPAPAPAPPTKLYVQLRNPDGTLRPDWVSVPVDSTGRLMVGADRQPRAYYVTAALAATKGLE
ncbi:hypothetical protein DEIPH_ctg013orf0051 [Deinococcus phoenicis]|uniref:Peptidase M15C domain-containing protein n=1 Tax=Deinococcus phoenicis TaxID=1476583 RepID=A0A016QSQ6_9DEIO|nr:M15 family metallopeptidase [Deinococcus phoenicis]EYB68942.1 hypothetical protein DEIPH_ctg013orf0051 [Deinococcus phoenicis]